MPTFLAKLRKHARVKPTPLSTTKELGVAMFRFPALPETNLVLHKALSSYYLNDIYTTVYSQHLTYSQSTERRAYARVTHSMRTLFGAAALALVVNVSALTVPATAGPYTFVSCWTDSNSVRTLANEETNAALGGNSNQTAGNCAGICEALGYTVMGTEYAYEVRHCYSNVFVDMR